MFPRGQKKKMDGGGEKSEDEGDAECLYCAGLFTEDHGVGE